MTTPAGYGLRTDSEALAIDLQLRAQGYRLAMDPWDRLNLQRDFDEIHRLLARGVLTATEHDRVRLRLLRTVTKHAKPVPSPENQP